MGCRRYEILRRTQKKKLIGVPIILSKKTQKTVQKHNCTVTVTVTLHSVDMHTQENPYVQE